MDTRKLPIGIEDFKEIRTQGFYYVDKTLLIRDLLKRWGKVNIFTRPRRFGKSLNMSMLKAFFEIGCDKALFEGLAIADEKALCEQYMGKFPVVSISLKGVDGLTFEDAYIRIRDTIRAEVSRLSFLAASDKIPSDDKRAFERFRKADVCQSLFMLTGLLEMHFGQKAILLIDEYDVPLDKAYQHGYYDQMLDLIRAMFGVALKTNSSLYFAVLTGCLRISNESIFTGLNNFKVNSISDEQYDEYFGFSDSEVAGLLNDYNLQSHHAEIKEWYDGYRFGAQDVYCPWDVINFSDDLISGKHAEPQTYWLNTSSNDMVRALIDKSADATTQMEIEDLISGRSVNKKINEKLAYNEIDKNIENIWSLLYMTGYLTVAKRPSNGVYELVIPNREVRQIYIEQVRSWFNEKVQVESASLKGFHAAFESGDVEKITEVLDAYLLNTVSFHDAHESFYHGFLLALLSTCSEWSVVSNAETGKGRSDIKVERKDRKTGFIVEVKDVKNPDKMQASCEAAIQQIEDKDYTATLRRYRFKDIWIYGIAFCDKECRVLAKHLS